ncbi:MAG: flagellar motor switch protein FliN [Candidatus Latescibacteria bacterium]|nr:flagellar motor switch protein FliN [Candidatus Latescibacterota bacterium]
MGKKRVLGQDPLTWIRRTDDTQEAGEEAPVQPSTVEAQEDSSAAPAGVTAEPPVGEETSPPTAMTVETTPTPEPTEKKEAMTAKTAVPQEKSQEETVVVRLAEFENFTEPPLEEKPEPKKMSLLMNLTLPITVELGRTEIAIKDILKLRQGSMIELDKLAGEPVDLVVNGRKLAEGEVVVIDESFGIRITNLVETSERELEELQSLGGGR